MNSCIRFAFATILGLGLLSFVEGSPSRSTEAGREGEALVRVEFDNPLNLIVVEARVGDRGPFRFCLDSGATSTIIDTELAKRIGLETGSFSTRSGTAAGTRVTNAPIRGGVDFGFGPDFAVHLDRVTAAPFTQAGRIMAGIHFDGILGSALFRRHVVEVDYANRTLALYDPSSYRYDGEGAVLDLGFPGRSKIPFIHATLDNRGRRLVDFRILVDSGGKTMGTASVATRSEWDGLITPENRIFDALGATGLSNDPKGMTHEAFFTRMDRLTLGPFEFENPYVSYSANGPGLAVMGATLLHRFTAVFDYSRKRLILEPNANFDKPHVFDRSGVLLVMPLDGEGFEVLFVADRTPAREAGLRRGDSILAVDGVRAQELQLNDVRGMFCRSKEYGLKVVRDGREFETVLKTRALFGD